MTIQEVLEFTNKILVHFQRVGSPELYFDPLTGLLKEVATSEPHHFTKQELLATDWQITYHTKFSCEVE